MLSFYLNLYQMHLSMYIYLYLFTSSSQEQQCTIMNHLILAVLFCSKNVTVRFARRTDVMPPIPLETKHHPSSVDLLLIKRLIAETSKQNLLQFLQHEFVNISKSYAERLIGKEK